MEDYAKFFGGVDDIDVSDLMMPVLVVGGGPHKSASTVKLFSKKTSTKSRKRTIIPTEGLDSIVGSGEGVCPAFSELENTKYLEEENKLMNELAAVVASAEVYGGFSDSDEELTDLDNTDNVAMAGAVLLDMEQFDGAGNHNLLTIGGADGEYSNSLLALDDNVSAPQDYDGDSSHSLLEITGDQ